VTSATYKVSGMTCDHCVRAVTTELIMLPGVRSVDIDLGEGAVTVTSDEPLDPEVVREAIDEAGYVLEG
jgi:copper chaperone